MNKAGYFYFLIYGMRQIYFLIILFVFQNSFSQTILKGKIINDVNPSGIIIVNFTTKQSVNCNSNGSFSIEAKNNDILIISSVNIEPKEIIVTNTSFEKELVIYIKSKSKELEEVTIKSITAKSLGIDFNSIATTAKIDADIKSSNGQANLFALVGLLFSPFKSKKLTKRELNDKYTKELLQFYDYTTIENLFKIPRPYIQSFITLSIENPEIIAALNSKNKSLLNFLLLETAKIYLKK